MKPFSNTGIPSSSLKLVPSDVIVGLICDCYKVLQIIYQVQVLRFLQVFGYVLFVAILSLIVGITEVLWKIGCYLG